MVCTNHSLQTLFLPIFFCWLSSFQSQCIIPENIHTSPTDGQWNISDSINFETEGRRFPSLLCSRTFVVSRTMHDDPKNDCEGDYKRFPLKFDGWLCFVLKDSSVFEYVHVQKSDVNKWHLQGVRVSWCFLGSLRCSRSSCRNEVNEECSIKFTHCRLELLAFKPRKCITHKKGGSKDVSDF